MDSFGTRRTVVPLLVHEDCMEGIHLDLANQQATLSNIASNTEETVTAVGTTTDAPTSNTVIGLLKSISNKLTSF